MERRREDVKTSPSSFSSAGSSPREVDGLLQMWPFLGVRFGAKVAGPQPNVFVTHHAKMRRFSKIMLLHIWIEQIQTEVMIPQCY